MIIQTRWTSRASFNGSSLESILQTLFRANTVPDSYDSTLINAEDIHSQEQESIEIDEHEDEILTTTCLSELPGDENIDPMESQDTELLSLSDNFKGPTEHDDNDEGTIDTSNK